MPRLDEAGLRALLARYRIDADIAVPRSETDAVRQVRQAVEDGCGAVIAAGGDGTAELVAGQLLNTSTALAILPLGSVMNLARSLGIPRDLEAAAEIIAAGNERSIDIGMADDRPFYECAEIGLYAAVFPEHGAFEGWPIGSIPRLIRVLASYRPVPVVMRIDGELVRTRALLVTVNNGPYGGLGFSFAPEARMDDGFFDVRIFRNFSKRELLRHFWSIAFGRRAFAPSVETIRGRSVVVESRGRSWRADGWTDGRTPVSFAIRPSALRVIVPERNRLRRSARTSP
jgi:diacylglycerol kinase (ATP)